MSYFNYFYRAAWGGELPNTCLDELTFDRDLEGAKIFAQAKSIEAGWCEVVTVLDGRHVDSPLLLGAIMYEHGQWVPVDGLIG
mgnify:FL=1